MNILKTVVLDSFEPAPLSFRLPLGMDTKLNLTFYKQDGAAYDSDLASQLQLTGRSTARMKTYVMPATDIVNGRATAYIPGNDLDDINGWQLRLLGTMNGEPMLLAVGTVMPVATAGYQVMPADLIDTIDLMLEYDEPVDLDVTVWQDASKGSIYDMTSNQTSVNATIYSVKGGAALVPFAVTVLAPNKVKLSLTAGQVNTLPPSCWWSMTGSNSAGATTLCEGQVTVTGTIAPTLEETVVSYDYQKPAGSVNPIGGQIIHSNIEQNLLKVAKTTLLAQDVSATLALIIPGDQITIDAVTWTVMRSAENVGWYDIIVAPVQQAAVSGTTLVTIRRP